MSTAASHGSDDASTDEEQIEDSLLAEPTEEAKEIGRRAYHRAIETLQAMVQRGEIPLDRLPSGESPWRSCELTDDEEPAPHENELAVEGSYKSA